MTKKVCVTLVGVSAEIRTDISRIEGTRITAKGRMLSFECLTLKTEYYDTPKRR